MGALFLLNNNSVKPVKWERALPDLQEPQETIRF